jgi:LmbE family N-acetylglucosaminyl deacetylase
MNFVPTFCVDVSDEIELKMRALAEYKTQFSHPGSSGVPEMVRRTAAYFGGRIGVAHAEPFFTYEVLGLGGLGELV